MTSHAKVGIVAAGYVAAFFLASAVVAIRVANTSGPDAQAESGMYAAGDAMLFGAVFGIVALVPTGVALVFLRPYRRFWAVFSAVGLAVAVSGLAAVALFAIGRHVPAPRLLPHGRGSPCSGSWSRRFSRCTCLVCTLLAPYRFPRLAFLAAATMEVAVSAYGGFVWFVPLFFSRV